MKHAKKTLKKWAKKKSLESYLHKNLLLNLDVNKPLKILEKAHFKSLVKITFKVYFVQQVYSKEIENLEIRKSKKSKSLKIVISSDSSLSESRKSKKLAKRDPKGSQGSLSVKKKTPTVRKRKRLRTLDD